MSIVRSTSSGDTDAARVTTPAPANGAGGLTWRQHVDELVRYRYLLRTLITRDLKVRYKNSLLGVLWSLLNPLAIMLILTLVFSVFANRPLRAYPVFVLVGLLPWNFFSSSLTAGTNSIVGNGNLIKKVYFPREILPASIVFSNFVNFAISLLLLLALLYWYGIGLTRHALWLPVILLAQMILTLGLVYLLSAAQVFYRDVMMILDVALLGAFFLTPIVYTLEDFGLVTLGEWTFSAARVMRWINPMASIIDAYRTVLWGTMTSNGPAAMGVDFLVRTMVTTIIIFAAGYAFFRRTEYLFGEKL